MTGQPVCTVIIACKELQAQYMMGVVNPFADVIGDEMNFDDNQNGLDKLFPLGPSCDYNGQIIPCFIGCSKNGSITSKLLTNMVKHIKEYAKFDWTDTHFSCSMDTEVILKRNSLNLSIHQSTSGRSVSAYLMGCTCGRLGIQRNIMEASSVQAKNSRQLWYKKKITKWSARSRRPTWFR